MNIEKSLHESLSQLHSNYENDQDQKVITVDCLDQNKVLVVTKKDNSFSIFSYRKNQDAWVRTSIISNETNAETLTLTYCQLTLFS